MKFYALILAFGLAACGGGGGSKMPDIYQDRPAPEGEAEGVGTLPPSAEPKPDDKPGFTVPAPVEQPIDTPVLEEAVNPVPIAEETTIDSELAATSRRCDDTSFGKGVLEACLLLSGDSISRYDSLTIQFSLSRAVGRVPEDLLRKLLEQNFAVRDSRGQKVDGRIVWKDTRSVLFDPYQELKPRETYEITIDSKKGDAQRPRSNQGRILAPFAARIATQSAFGMSHQLNGQAMPGNRGLSLNSQKNQKLQIVSQLDSLDQVQKLSLRRLGSRSERLLCEGSCQAQALRVDLAQELAPETGLNSYEYKVLGKSGEEEFHQFSFAWGDINTQPSAVIDGGLQLAIDRENGLKSLSRLVAEYAAGRFTMDYREASGEVKPKMSFNDIIKMRRKTYKSGVDGPCDARANRGDFEYLLNLGPYCALQVEGSTGILGGLFGQVKYKAVTDIYVTDMRVLEEEGNVTVSMRPEAENIAMTLGTKRFQGNLRVVLKINEAKYMGAIPVPGATGYFTYDTKFELNGPMRETLAKADLILVDGRLQIKLRGSENFDLKQSVQGQENSPVYFNTRAWTDNVVVSAVTPIDEQQGLWAKLVNFVVNEAVEQEVDNFKPQIVNGIARDILQVVAPNALNTLVEQMKAGLQVFLPRHLPAPFDTSTIRVAGGLTGGISPAVRGDNSYLNTRVQFNLSANVPQAATRPTALQGEQGFVRTPGGQRAPDALSAVENAGAGSLLAVSLDVVNQTLFDIWQKGGLGVQVDHAFVQKVEQFAVFDEQNSANGKEILLAEFLPKLMGSDVTRMQGKDKDGRIITMSKDDSIRIRLDPKLPPFLKVQSLDRADGKRDLRFALGLSDVQLLIEGLRGDQVYTLAKLRFSTTAQSEIKFVPYQNPLRQPEFSGAGALSVHISPDVATLDYMVEVIEGAEANSFALDSNRLRDTIADMVDRLFIPLFNDGLREVPLTGLRTCGIELDAGKIEILPLPASVQTPFLLLKAPLKNYAFSGHCDLMPDLTSPLPPLPPVVEEPEEGGGSGDGPTETPGEAGRIELTMDFSKIPWQLNGSGKAPELDEGCKTQIFFDVSCAVASVVYEQENGQPKLDERGRPIYDYTHITLSTLVPKDAYKLRGPAPSVEDQFYAFERWPEYVQGAEDRIIIKDSVSMPEVETQLGTFKRHYVEFATNSPKASGFIPIRDVTLHRILEKPFEGAEVTTEFFVNTHGPIAVPASRKPLTGAEGLDYHVGNIHIFDCAKLSWCSDDSQWLVIYDSKLRPQDKSIPEDVVPYLKSGLNAIIAGMFPLDI